MSVLEMGVQQNDLYLQVDLHRGIKTAGQALAKYLKGGDNDRSVKYLQTW